MNDNIFKGNEADLKAIQKGAASWNDYVDTKRSIDSSWRADLRGVDLSMQNLPQADFQNAILDDANFNDANLEAAKFENASLARATFVEATMFRSWFRYAELIDANFRGADLRWSNFRDAVLIRTNFEDANTQAAVFAGTELNSDNAKYENQTRTTTGNNQPDIKHRHWFQSTINETPLMFSNDGRSDELLVLQSLSLRVVGKHNQIEKILETVIDGFRSDPDIDDIRIVAETELAQLCHILSFSIDGSANEREKIASAMFRAMSDDFAVPYYGSWELLTPENFNMIKGAYTYVLDTGVGKILAASIAIGCSIIILFVSWATGKATAKVIEALGEKAVRHIGTPDLRKLDD